MNEINAVLTIASRDIVKLLRDRLRMLFTIGGSFVFIILMGGTLQDNLGRAAGYDFVGYVFTGVLGMSLFQNSAMGLVSLIQDRETDFSQEMFVAPISRYSIVFGKILGETVGSFLQALPMIGLAFFLGVALTATQVLLLVTVSLFAGLLGGSFGMIVMSLFNNQRRAQQILPFLTLPQIFLAGIFNPIKVLPWYLSALSLATPLRYVVDLNRAVVYAGQPSASRVVLLDPITNVAVVAAMFTVFLAFGTWLFVRQETNR